MARSDYGNMCVRFDEGDELFALAQTQIEDFAALAGGEQAGRAVALIPFDERFKGSVVDFTRVGEGGNHDRPETVDIFQLHFFQPSFRNIVL